MISSTRLPHPHLITRTRTPYKPWRIWSVVKLNGYPIPSVTSHPKALSKGRSPLLKAQPHLTYYISRLVNVRMNLVWPQIRELLPVYRYCCSLPVHCCPKCFGIFCRMCYMCSSTQVTSPFIMAFSHPSLFNWTTHLTIP